MPSHHFPHAANHENLIAGESPVRDHQGPQPRAAAPNGVGVALQWTRACCETGIDYLRVSVARARRRGIGQIVLARVHLLQCLTHHLLSRRLLLGVHATHATTSLSKNLFRRVYRQRQLEPNIRSSPTSLSRTNQNDF